MAEMEKAMIFDGDNLYQPRRSKCAARSRELEQERIRRMTVEERIKSALSMSARFSWLKPVRRED